MSQINYAVSLHSRETATVKDVSRCCCPGDCSFESPLQQVCIPCFSLDVFIYVYKSDGQRLQIKWNQIKQYTYSIYVMLKMAYGL